jgi:tRNA(Ile)-lysidine synthase
VSPTDAQSIFPSQAPSSHDAAVTSPETPIRSLAAAWRRFGSPQRLGIALSGGGDSLALLHAAVALAAKRGLTVHALHINHRLRPEVDAEEDFCRRRAAEWGAEFASAVLDPREFAGNLHEAARQARYRELARLAEAAGLEIVLTAHTLDDQAETVLQRILRGSGPLGLAGIRERAGGFGRPWLGVRRATLREYLRRRDIEWLEDPTNQNRRYLRSRLRAEVLPLLESVGGKKTAAALGRLAELAALEREALDEWAAADFETCVAGDGLAVGALQALSPARRNLVLRLWLRQNGVIPPKKVIADLENVCLGPGPAGPLAIPGGLSVTRDYTTLNWARAAIVETPWTPFSAEAPVDRVFAGGRIRLIVGPATTAQGESGFRVSPRALAGADWRPPWPGARIRPRGMTGRVKCSDLFVNAKIPRELRGAWPVLARNDAVLLVPGLRAAEDLTPARSEESWVVRLEWL